MRLSLKPLVGVLISMFICAGAGASVSESVPGRFQAIPERNLFGLKTPQPPKLQSQSPALPKIVLTGITTILGNKRALMKELPVGAKPGNPSQERSLILTEGQRDGDIEVVTIDEDAGTVQVNNSGTVMTLSFEKDGARLPQTPPPIPTPGIVAQASGPHPATAYGTGLSQTNIYNYYNSLPTVPNSRTHTLPSRSYRLRSNAGTPPTAEGGVPSPTGNGAPYVVAENPAQDLTFEQQQAEILQLQREAARMDPNNLAVPTPAGASPTTPTPSKPGSTFGPGITVPPGWPQVLPQ